MEQVYKCLDPSLTEIQMLKHLPHVKKKLESISIYDDDFTFYNSSKPLKKERILQCSECKNENVEYMFMDKVSGDYICLGPDNKGCGFVLNSSVLIPSYDVFEQEMEGLFSEQKRFESFMVGGSCALRKTNELVEKMMSQVGKEDQTTSDYYKDKQRSDVYETIDQTDIICSDVPLEVCEHVKFLFHEYRNKVTRIHKLRLVLSCLFYIAFNECNK
mmetsp:Transcript_8730/g.11518  ORF Transcript_8730/g.11518 Transcript_8730/m.11518 type:complete len:216 (-) Transcript_8730:2933-3580(-)